MGARSAEGPPRAKKGGGPGTVSPRLIRIFEISDAGIALDHTHCITLLCNKTDAVAPQR